MKAFFVVIIIVLSTLPAACSSKPNSVSYFQEAILETDASKQAIYVVSHGWHTGLVIPAIEIQSRFPMLKKRFGSVPFLEIGWGDKGFYQANEITTGLTLSALFWPTEAVIHAVAVPEKIEDYFPNSNIEKLCLNKGEIYALINFISNSFQKNQEDEIIELNTGIYGNSQFYKGMGNFHLMNTCNKWTAKGLKSAGMDISPTFKLTADSVMGFIQKRKKTAASTRSTHSTATHNTRIICR